MNVTNLILQLKSKITSDTLDQQMISKAIKLLEIGAVDLAGSFSVLPAAASNTGKIYFIQFDGLYWSTGVYWIRIAKSTEEAILSTGNNTYGALGDLTFTHRSSPVNVVSGFSSEWTDASFGRNQGAGISRGCAFTWGCSGAFGNLGNGSTSNLASPALVAVCGGFTDWCKVESGTFGVAGLRQNGTIWSWGYNSTGTLGDNTVANRASPVSAVGGFTDWSCISFTNRHVVALRTNGTAWAWGSGATDGRLGDGAAVNRSSPVSVVGGFTDWTSVAAGTSHSLGLRSNGTIWGWGNNGNGALGDGTNICSSSPVSVVGGFTDWCQVSAGQSFSAALRTNGTLWTWGNNNCGRLGNGTAGPLTYSSSPVSVVGGFTDWCCVSAGREQVHALRTNGTLWSWGINYCGHLGDNTIISRSSPVSVVGGFTDWWKIASGYNRAGFIRRKAL